MICVSVRATPYSFCQSTEVTLLRRYSVLTLVKKIPAVPMALSTHTTEADTELSSPLIPLILQEVQKIILKT